MAGFVPDLLETRAGGAPSLSPLLLNDGVRQSFAYERLPQQLLNLSVLKLDGSSFEIQVARTASVAELKEAVEDSFTQVSKEGRFKISWSHVWGHFCLCYKGEKFLDDKAFIRNFGIRDGQQLRFVRNLSTNYNLVKR